jgi:O-antigen ligase
MLSIRPDFASACFVVLAVTAAQRALHLRRKPFAARGRLVVELVLLAWSVAVTLRLGARSGLIALVVAVLLIGGRLVPAFRRLPGRVRIGLVLGAVVALVVVAPRVHAFNRLGQTVQAFGIGVDPNKPPPDATGTAHARLEAWRHTLRYTNAKTDRQLVGVGFGPNFLHESGAEALLVGQTKDGQPFYSGVRAPHNFLLNTYARMGFVGLGIVLVAFGWVLAAAVRLMRRSPLELDVMAVAIFVAILIVAMFGVILESPFGAIPAFWAAGWILVREQAARPRTAVDLARRR